jgi:uncharacterized protein with ParB-like and HNH nuclease domain
MDSQSRTFQDIMGNSRRYIVPPFQRDYSWDNEQWEDLWEDIDSLKDEMQHYMGYVVIQNDSNNKKEFKVIDGQQRLATISIIILTAIKRIQDNIDQNIEVEDNTKRIEEIRRKYVGSLDPISLNSYNRLTLNRNNNPTFRELSSLREPSLRKMTKTNKNMLDAFNFFYKKISERSGQELAGFVESFTEGLLFTEITVTSDLNAYKVFETLNARGVQLSTPDLLKNYLFSVIHKDGGVIEDEMDDLDRRWEGVVVQLGKLDFSFFLRVDFNAEYEHTTKNDLFRKIRKKIDSRKSSYEYLNRIEKRAPVFAALSTHNDDFWTNHKGGRYKDVERWLYVLNLFNIKQHYTILLTAFEKFEPEDFVKLVKYLAYLSIRYNVICKKTANEQERSYGIIARKITKGDFLRVSHIKNCNEFKRLYPTDEEFMDSFKNKQLTYNSNQRKIRYLLSALEQNLGNKIINPYSGTGEATIEHILPQNVTKYWKDIFEDDSNESIDKLGNVILLSEKENKECGASDFDIKKDIYSKSDFYIAKKISEYEKWDREQLSAHQKWLSEQAVETWKINYN